MIENMIEQNLARAKKALEQKGKESKAYKAEIALIKKGYFDIYRKVVFRDIYQKEIKEAWFDEYLSRILYAVLIGELKRVIISMPPRYGKTEWAVRLFVSYIHGMKPQAKVQYVTYGDTLSVRTSVELKNIMLHKKYKEIFPHVAFDPMQNQKDNWKLKTWGEYYATSVGGAVTGIGSNYTIVDDPLKAMDASSPAEKKKVIEFYKSSVVTRLEDDGAIIIIMQRLAEDDLVGWLLKKEREDIEKGLDVRKWKVVSLPVLSEHEEIYTFEDFYYKRAANEPLNVNQHTYDQLQAIKRDMTEAEFNKQYCQNPEVSKSGVFKEEDITFISEFDFPPMRKYIAVDRAESLKDGADDRAVAVTGWSIDEEEVERQVLLDGRYGTWNIYELCENIIIMMMRYRSAEVWIEEPKDGFVSTVLKNEILKINVKLRKEGKTQMSNPIRTYTPPTNRSKQQKISIAMLPIEQHLFKVSKECDSGFYEKWKKELLAFDPEKRHQKDNCIDASFSPFLFAVPVRVKTGERVTTSKRIKKLKKDKGWRF